MMYLTTQIAFFEFFNLNVSENPAKRCHPVAQKEKVDGKNRGQKSHATVPSQELLHKVVSSLKKISFAYIDTF